MGTNLTAKSTIIVNAPASKVWQALTDPKLIKQYLFGTDAKSDWKEGSTLTYSGVWEGKAYEDKGKILKVVPEKLLETTYWSSMRGLPDQPENYNKVTYQLSAENGSTTLTITQDNVKTEQEREHSEKNWGMVLQGLKKLLEN